jgi:hypothetical protein
VSEAAADRLRRLRRTDSEVKTARVRAALDAAATAGEAMPVAQIARVAGVSRRFIYDHPELRAEIELKAAQAVAQFSGRLAASARVSAASLRAEGLGTGAPPAAGRLSAALAGLDVIAGRVFGRAAVDLLPDVVKVVALAQRRDNRHRLIPPQPKRVSHDNQMGAWV